MHYIPGELCNLRGPISSPTLLAVPDVKCPLFTSYSNKLQVFCRVLNFLDIVSQRAIEKELSLHSIRNSPSHLLKATEFSHTVLAQKEAAAQCLAES